MHIHADTFANTIIVRIDNDGERDALIHVLDNDRNHPARSQLYDALREQRSRKQAAEIRERIYDAVAKLDLGQLTRVQDVLITLQWLAPVDKSAP